MEKIVALSFEDLGFIHMNRNEDNEDGSGLIQSNCNEIEMKMIKYRLEWRFASTFQCEIQVFETLEYLLILSCCW